MLQVHERNGRGGRKVLLALTQHPLRVRLRLVGLEGVLRGVQLAEDTPQRLVDGVRTV
ncbi:hypothetical protein [Streptomyces alfalfae]